MAPTKQTARLTPSERDYANLSKSEAAQLAAYLPNPKYYQDHPADRKVRTRKARIQRYMGYVRLPKDE